MSKYISDEPGYTHEDGSPDTIEDIILSARALACAINHMLKDTEGIVIVMPHQELYPDEPFGKYIVYKDNHQIKVIKCETEQELSLEEGQYLWLHKPEEKEKLQ